MGLLNVYALLTVGDGLVSQIPALLISRHRILVTGGPLPEAWIWGLDVTGHSGFYPKILGIAAVVIGLFGLVPGLPTIPFLVRCKPCWAPWLYLLSQEKQRRRPWKKREPRRRRKAGYRPENVLSLLAVDPMELEIGYSLIPLVDKTQGGDLFERVSMIRRQVALELGIILPPIQIRDNMQLSPNQYVIKIKGGGGGRG